MKPEPAVPKLVIAVAAGLLAQYDAANAAGRAAAKPGWLARIFTNIREALA